MGLIKMLRNSLVSSFISLYFFCCCICSSINFPKWMNVADQGILLGQVLPPINVTVALDGSGDFDTVTAAILGAPDHSTHRYIIYLKRGVYFEYITIEVSKMNLMLIGEGVDAKIISGNRSSVDGYETYKTATFAVNGQGFIAMDITFQNTAGREKEQAGALRSAAENSVYFRCSFTGFQDTLNAHMNRQFYRECLITGTVDFIFGFGTAVFQECKIIAKQGRPNAKNAITANGRSFPNDVTGFSFLFCNFSADLDSVNPTPTYLGRPWKAYSRTVVMKSYVSGQIQPQGWLPWDDTGFALDTLYYGEYMNHGPGAAVTGRMNWPGYHVMKTTSEAEKFTVANFINGDSWLPSTGVNYTSGLIQR